MKIIRSLSMLLLLMAIAVCAIAQNTALTEVTPLTLLDGARADMDAGLTNAALEKLDSLRVEQLDATTALQWHNLRASVYSLQGKLLDAIRERVAADALLVGSPARRRNQEAILEALALLTPERLAGYTLVSGDPLSGWLALGKILLAHDAPGIQQQTLAQWRQDYPDHPADSTLVTAALARPAPTKPTAATSVAVLLPAAGSNKPYGEAIRQGIIAAHAADPAATKPALHFYDSEAGDILSTYRQALTEGAEAVIGPLHKDQVAALLKADELPKPVLALNQIDAERDNFYQFSLLPEDELEQVADRAWQEGRRNALLLIPTTGFGQRMLGHFNQYWPRLGGRVTAVQTYMPGRKDFAEPIKKLLRVDEPSADRPQVPRNDADVIFLIAEARDARMLTPQLRYYGAIRLPIYATAMVYSGHPNRPQDQDLAGVMFCDAAWLLSEDNSAQRPTSTPGSNPRLWAMGVDAYRLSRQRNLLQGENAHYAGASGTLSLQAGNRIHRQLSCAQFDGGLPVLRNAAPATPEQVAH